MGGQRRKRGGPILSILIRSNRIRISKTNMRPTGNNAVEMQTTATYDAAAQEFVIHTPTTLAQVRRCCWTAICGLGCVLRTGLGCAASFVCWAYAALRAGAARRCFALLGALLTNCTMIIAERLAESGMPQSSAPPPQFRPPSPLNLYQPIRFISDPPPPNPAP